MGYKKGESGNPAGRKPGALNKKTVAQINRAEALLQAIEEDSDPKALVASLTPKEKAALYVDLLEFTQPKLARQENINKEKAPRVLEVRHFHQISMNQPEPRKSLENTQDATFTIIPLENE